MYVTYLMGAMSMTAESIGSTPRCIDISYRDKDSYIESTTVTCLEDTVPIPERRGIYSSANHRSKGTIQQTTD
jgi:hypothetical protein